MTTFAQLPDLPALHDLRCRQLNAADTPAVMALQADMLAALPDSHWYYPSPAIVFEACFTRGESFGFFQGETLAGFGTLTPWYIRPETCYAHKVGEDPHRTMDFQDVMVSPAFRRRGIHTALLDLFDRVARQENATALYCTIAPENEPSITSFQKAGYHWLKTQPAYEGMPRGYYRKEP